MSLSAPSTLPTRRPVRIPGGVGRALARLALAALLAGPVSAAMAAEPARIVVFDLELAAGATTDPSGQTPLGAMMLQYGPTSPPDVAKLTRAGDELRRLVAALPGLTLGDLSGQAEAIDKARPILKCNGCEIDIARAAGADLAIVGRVTKLTTVLVHIDIEVRDVAAGRTIRAASVDVNGDTEETWLRGVRWLVRNRLAEPPLR